MWITRGLKPDFNVFLGRFAALGRVVLDAFYGDR
jgi:hypothetical protein